jgi:hypothetical protein
LKRLNKIVLVSLVCLFASIFCFSQQTKKNSGRPDLFYYGATAGGNAAILGGAEGRLRTAYINDFISYVKDRGYKASGFLLPRFGINAGLMGGYNVAKKFSLESSLAYSQRGIREAVNYEYEDSIRTVKYKSSLSANLDYIDFVLGIRYQHISGITIFTGLVSSLNIVDKVRQTNDYQEIYANFPSANLTTSQDSVLFVHQYYGVNRKIYLPAYVWRIGYTTKKALDFNLSIEKSSNIFVNDQSVDPNFITIKFNVVYRLDYFDRRKKGYSR